jgi:hypothetical protein
MADNIDSSSYRRARDLVMEYGWNTTCFQIVNPGIEHWFSSRGDAVTGFVTANNYRVVGGAPACSLERLADVVTEFETDTEALNERVCYFLAEARLESTLANSPDHSFVLLGAQPVWNPPVGPRSSATISRSGRNLIEHETNTSLYRNGRPKRRTVIRIYNAVWNPGSNQKACRRSISW